jgi:hypothetical protein
MIVSQYTLLPEVPHPPLTYQVTVTLPRPDRDEVLLPPGGHAAVELAAAVIAAHGLLTAWTCTQSVVSMIVELPSLADALAAGVAVAQVLGGGDGMASVTAERVATGLRLRVEALRAISRS